MAMPVPPRQISIAKPTAASRQSGVLPVPSSAASSRDIKSAQKGREAKLKVVVRRLAPELTEEEFRAALGEEWKIGRGKVDWASYQKGKIAKDAAKPSRPSRAYLHLTQPQYLGLLADKVKATQFIDAKGSSSDSVLLGPPLLVFTPYNKIPGKARADGRQGTIDQDPEFIDFLASLTNPVVKPANIDSVNDKENKLADVKTVTPLVQYIKDKKANKGKDGKLQKHGRQELKDNKGDDKKAVPKGGKSKPVIVEKKAPAATRIEKVKQDQPAKLVKKSPASNNVQLVTAAATPQPGAQNTTLSAKPERRRERGNASIAAKILQRDLALANGASGRRRRDNSASTNDTNSEKATLSANVQNQFTAWTESVTASETSKLSTESPSVPTAARKTMTPNTTVQQAAPTPPKTQTTVSSTSTQAFLKHANPSQGVTEPLLEEAFKTFGTVNKVEIDKKKGFAYVDFAEASSLQKAIAASPVKVAQGQVVVLERKTGAILQNRNARGQQGPALPTGPANRGSRGGGRARSGRGLNNPKVGNSTPVNGPKPTTLTAPT